jgi:anti-sigma-K factor RskA
LLTPVHPSWQVLQRIQSDLGHQPAPAPSSLYRKPATNDTSAAETSGADIVETQRATQSPARQTSAADPGLAGGSPKRRTSVHTEPYFSALPDVPPATESAPGAATAVDANAPPSSVSPAAPNDPPLPSAPLPKSADDALHVMGERDPRRTDHATYEKPHKEKKRAPTPREEPRQGPRSITGNIWLWRGATLVFGLIAVVLATIPSTPAKPPVTVVEVAPTQAAILQAPGQSSTPGWIVTIDAQRNVLLSPQVRTDIPSDAAVQLWTRSKTMPQPRSLGLIDPNQPVTVPAALMGELSPDQLFEMTQEPAGGSPTASPSGPVLFIGRLVTFGKKAPVASPDGAAGGVAGGVSPGAGSR